MEQDKESIDLSGMLKEKPIEYAPQNTPLIRSTFARFLIKYSGGLIKTEKAASVILVILSLVVISFAVYNAFGGFSNKKPANRPPGLQERTEKLKK